MILNIAHKALEKLYAAGNWKDITSFNLLLDEMGLSHKNIYTDESHFDAVLDQCGEDVTDLVIQYSYWPKLLRDIRKKAPWIRLHVRAHNAEALQHWQRSKVTFTPKYQNLRAVYGSVRLLWSDTLCRCRADTLLGISDWDNRHYWRLLPGSARILHMPYFSPWPYLRPHISMVDWSQRRRAIICMAGADDRIGASMVENFELFAKYFMRTENGGRWQFLLSPGVFNSRKSLLASQSVELLESLVEPWDLLCSVRAVAVITPLGFGVKTTIIDALAAGCHVLVHPVIARRLPDEVRKHCILADPGRTSELDRVIDQLEEPPAVGGLNGSLRQQASLTLAAALA